MNHRFALGGLLLYVAVVAVVASHHEPWRDEADSWLLTRDGSSGEIAKRAHYGGFPILWYALVTPLAKGGLPYASQTVLNALFAIAAAALILFFAPFSRTTKLLILFSYFLGFEYSAIARPYALSIALLFAAAAFHPRRNERPVAYALLLALAMNVNAQAFVLAAVLAAVFVLERREWKTFAIVLAGVAAMVFQVRPLPGGQRIATLHAFNVTPAAISMAFLPTLPQLVGVVAGIVVIGAVAWALRRNAAALLVLLGSTGGLLLMFVLLWLGGPRHAGFLLIGVLLAIWVAGGLENRVAHVLLNLVLAVSCVVAMRTWRQEITMRFSGSREMALFLREHGIDREPIAAHNLTQCEAVLPYLDGTKFWYAGLREWGTYLPWDHTMEQALDTPYPVAVEWARGYFRERPWHLLLNVEMPDPARNGFRLVYATHEPVFGVRDERYWLYEPLR